MVKGNSRVLALYATKSLNKNACYINSISVHHRQGEKSITIQPCIDFHNREIIEMQKIYDERQIKNNQLDEIEFFVFFDDLMLTRY